MESKDRNLDSGPDNHHEWEEVVRPNQRPAVSQRTYWIRRIVALLILIAFITLVVIGVKALAKALSSGEEKPKATGSEQAKQTPDPAATGTEKDEKEAEKETDKDADQGGTETEPAVDASGPQECDVANLEMTVTAPSTQFSSAQTNQFSVITKYSGEEPCTIDAGPGNRPVTVFSGEDRIWSSADCDETGARVLVLANGVQDTAQMKWDMRRSEKSCTPDLAKAKPGTYRAVVTLGKTESEPYVFNVVD